MNRVSIGVILGLMFSVLLMAVFPPKAPPIRLHCSRMLGMEEQVACEILQACFIHASVHHFDPASCIERTE